MEIEISTKNEKKIIKVPLKMISQEININPRSHLIMENIDNLVRVEDFPEIHLGELNRELIIVDGYHRFAAAQRLEREDIYAYVTHYDSLEEMRIDAFKENVNHGIKLDDYEIAKWIHDNYFEAVEKNVTLSIIDFINKAGVVERIGRKLFRWYVVHKDVLEDQETELKKVGNIEEIYSIVIHFNKDIKNISEDFKIKFKQFYEKYSELKREELRKAISWFKEGKDYDEEIAKEKEQFRKDEEYVDSLDEADKKAWFDGFDPIGDDAIDRNGIADYSDREETKAISQANKEIEKLVQEHEELNKEIEKEATKEIDEEKVLANKLLDSISKSVMHLNMLIAKDKVVFDFENVITLENLRDRMNEMLSKLNSDKIKENEKERFI